MDCAAGVVLPARESRRVAAPFVAAALLALGNLASLPLLGGAYAPWSPTSRLEYAALHPEAWLAGWLVLMPGLFALAAVLARWTHRVAPPAWRAAGVGFAVAAVSVDLLSVVLLAVAPGRVPGYLLPGSSLSGVATALWTLAILVPVVSSDLRGAQTRCAWSCVASTAALAAVTLAAADSGVVGAGLQLALAAVAVVAVPVLLLYLGASPPRAVRDAVRDGGRGASNDYRIATTWVVRARMEELCAVFLDAVGISRWWRAAFLDVAEVRGGDSRGVGRVLRLHTKGWLPYTLVLHAEVLACDLERGFSLRTWGDFEGSCVCRAKARDGRVRLVFDWRVRAEKPVLRRFSWLLKPLFTWNHRWVMRQGRRGLATELARRRGCVEPRASRDTPVPTFPYDPVTRALAPGLSRLLRV